MKFSIRLRLVWVKMFYVKHFMALWVFGQTRKPNQTKINYQLTVKYGQVRSKIVYTFILHPSLMLDPNREREREQIAKLRQPISTPSIAIILTANQGKVSFSLFLPFFLSISLKPFCPLAFYRSATAPLPTNLLSLMNQSTSIGGWRQWLGLIWAFGSDGNQVLAR